MGPTRLSLTIVLLSLVAVECGDRPLGQSVTLEASNPGPAVRLDIATLTVGGSEGVSGNVAGPDTITVGRTVTIPARTAELRALGTFPVSDPGRRVLGPGASRSVAY